VELIPSLRSAKRSYSAMLGVRQRICASVSPGSGKGFLVATKFEYYVRRLGVINYEVAKFGSMTGGEQPLVVYKVIYDPSRNRGLCDCPAGMYRGTGILDKHVRIVQDWIAGGEQEIALLR